MYLSYLPLVLSEIDTTIIYFDELLNLENEIKLALNIELNALIVERFKPNLATYQEYCEHCGTGRFYKRESSCRFQL